MRVFQIFPFFLFSLSVIGQKTQNFELIDEFKINKIPTKVFFNDPLKQLANDYPDFDRKIDKEKYDLLDDYLHRNTLYIFQTTDKNGEIKSYLLKGNSKKVRTKYFFNLEIIYKNVLGSPTIVDSNINRNIDKINLGGTFFENMYIFKSKSNKNLVGEFTKIWGYFTVIQRYSSVKEAISEIITKDMKNEIPEDILLKQEVVSTPLFSYESCGLNSILEREMVITVYQYDSKGLVKDKSPRTEKDADLYHASTSIDDICAVTAFPFFSSTDSVETDKNNKSLLYVNSSQPFINHYLKDIKVFRNENTGNVERIEAKLKIHGYSAQGESIDYELYVAEFSKFGECFLPKTIKFCSIDDIEYKTPRLITEISYKQK